MTPQQIQLLEGILSYDRSLIERGKEPLSETALALYVQLVAAQPSPTLGVHRSYARLGEEIGSRSANGKPMKAKAIAKAVRELDTHELFERRRDNPLTHAADGPGSIHVFHPVELTEIIKPASGKAVEAILNAAGNARNLGPVNFAVGMRLLYRADATLSLSGLSQQELAEAAGVVRETAFKALDILQANKLFVASWGKTGERRNRDSGRKQAEFSVQLFAGERVEAAAPTKADDAMIEIAPVEERTKTRRRSTAEVEAELEELLAASAHRKELETALDLIQQRAKKKKNGVYVPVKFPASERVALVRELLELEKGPHAPKLGRALAKTNKTLFAKGGTGFQRRYIPWLMTILEGDSAPELKPSATQSNALETEIRALLLRCSELNGRKDQHAARELFKQQVWPRRDEIAKQLFAGNRELATASLREAFKTGVDWFVGIKPMRVYALNYDTSFTWPAHLNASEETQAVAV